jgi:hypothetical protein
MSEESKTADPNTPKVPPAKKDALAEFRRIGEVVIELGDDRNRKFLYPPTGQELRGSWKKANLIGITMDARMTSMPDLPGMYIILDCKRARLKIVDPLEADENRELLRQAQAVHKEIFRTIAGPAKSYSEDNLNETKLKTNLYWMRRMVDSLQARIVSGDLPGLETIYDMPGFTRTEAWNSSARARKYREEPDDEVSGRNQAATRY